jgi:hypothetical protein
MAKDKNRYFLARWIIFTIRCNGEMMMPGAKGRQWGDDDAWGQREAMGR